MDWQQKFAAIQAFAGTYEAHLCMRRPGDWYLHCGMSVGGDGLLTGKYGNGSTPEEAVNDHWEIYSNLPYTAYAVNRENKRTRWNGFMWIEVTEEEAAELMARSA